MIAPVPHVHKVLNWFLSIGVPAGIIALYVAYIYPLVGPVGTIIVVLSLLVTASLVTIRVTRKLYGKTLITLSETQEQARLVQVARTAVATSRREQTKLEERLKQLEERLKPKVEVSNIFWDQYEAVDEAGQPETVQLLRLEITSTEATWAQVTVDKIELDGHLYRKIHLHIQHKPWDVNKTELLPDRPEYWDVVQKARRSDDIELMHVENIIPHRLLHKGYKIRFRVTVACDKGLGVSQWITIERNDGELDFDLDT